nr:immunoglobulin light chain junction region [Macaca mulatta]
DYYCYSSDISGYHWVF